MNKKEEKKPSVPKTKVRRKVKMPKTMRALLVSERNRVNRSVNEVQVLAQELINMKLESYAKELGIDIDNEDWDFDFNTFTFIESKKKENLDADAGL